MRISVSEAENRKADAAKYSENCSKANHFLPKASHTEPVVFEPAKISTTISPGLVRNLIKN